MIGALDTAKTTQGRGQCMEQVQEEGSLFDLAIQGGGRREP